MSLDRKKLFHGKGLFVFSDPAGCNAVLALVKQLCEREILTSYEIYTNNLDLDISNELSITKQINFNNDICVEIIKKLKPDYLFTATSLNAYEHEWRKVAKDEDIKSIAFIDHWTNYYNRFCYKDEVIFTDVIWVINEKAKIEAIEEGLPEDKIIIDANPYYEEVRNYKTKCEKKSFFEEIDISVDKKTILFISDDIKRGFGQRKNGGCILGYDEYTTLEKILKAFRNISSKRNLNGYQLLIKLHPKSEDKKFDELINEFSPQELSVKVVRKCDTLLTIYFSDYILGMFSNMVIESIIMGRAVTRVIIGQDTIDPFKFDLNNCHCVRDEESLENTLFKIIN